MLYHSNGGEKVDITLFFNVLEIGTPNAARREMDLPQRQIPESIQNLSSIHQVSNGYAHGRETVIKPISTSGASQYSLVNLPEQREWSAVLSCQCLIQYRSRVNLSTELRSFGVSLD
jgi:hypothetical protein